MSSSLKEEWPAFRRSVPEGDDQCGETQLQNFHCFHYKEGLLINAVKIGTSFGR